MRITEKFWAIFDKTILVMLFLSAALVLFDTLAVTVDVLVRSAFGITYSGLFEIIEYTLLWITFLGTAWIMRQGGHICIDLVANRLNPRYRVILNAIVTTISVILLAGITWYCIRLTMHDLRTNFTLASVLHPPKWPIEIIIPIGFFLLFIQSARNTYGFLMNWKNSFRGQRAPSDSTAGGKL
jgi:C4-dicarboxylate transporter DctQ subunit